MKDSCEVKLCSPLWLTYCTEFSNYTDKTVFIWGFGLIWPVSDTETSRQSNHNHKWNILQVRMRFWSLYRRLRQRTKYGGPTSAWATTAAQYHHPSSVISWRIQAGECPQMILPQKEKKKCLSLFPVWPSQITNDVSNVMILHSNVTLIGTLVTRC